MKLTLFFVLLFGGSLCAQVIPDNPNKTDSQGKRQGVWTIRFNNNWEPVSSKDSAHFYRIIRYKNDKPTGIVHDYYLNGTMQWSGTLLEDRPADVYDYSKPFHFYKEDGSENLRSYYSEMAYHFEKELLFDEALENYFKAAEIIKAENGSQHPDYATALLNIGFIYRRKGVYRKADSLFTEVEKIRLNALGREHDDYAGVLYSHASLCMEINRFAEAEALYIELRNIFAITLGKLSEEYALITSKLAGLYYDTGDYLKAEQHYLELKSLREQTLGKNNWRYAEALNGLGLVYTAMGSYTNAENCLLEAKVLRLKLLGPDDSAYATSLHNLGSLYGKMGNFEKAIEYNLEARSIYAKIAGKNSYRYAMTLNNLGGLYYSMKQYEKAEGLYLESKNIFERTIGKNKSDYAMVLTHLAVLYNDMNRKDEAEKYYLESVEVYSRAIGNRHRLYCIAISNLAAFYGDIGKYEQAESLLLEAKKVREETLGKEHPDYTVNLINLATIYNNQAKYEKAEHYYLEAASLKAKEISRFFSSLSEKEKQQYYNVNKVYFSRFESFCLSRQYENPAINGDLFNLRLITKGILFNNSNKMRDNIMHSNDTTLINKFESWKLKKDYLAKVYQMSLTEKQENGINEKQLEEEINTLEKELSQRSVFFSNSDDNKLFTWRDVQKQLKEGEAAVEIIETQSMIVALIVTSQTKNYPDLVEFKHAQQMASRSIKFYRNSILSQREDSLSYNTYWQPLANRLAGIKKVYFSPDGIFHQINLNTLRNPATGKYLIDEVDLQLVSSSKALLITNSSPGKSINAVTMFGYPDYNLAIAGADGPVVATSQLPKSVEIDSTLRFFSRDKITELPGTKAELNAIETLLKQKKIPVKKFLFDQATEEEVKKVSNPKVLHIATHGFFLADLSQSDGAMKTFAGIDANKISDNPLLRSGLLLAGAAKTFRTEQNDGEDGVLFAYEAMNLKLDDTDLVVMSACETGLGIATNGEGVYGLQRAFQTAGAKSVLMSLWGVSDDATQKLMTLFYRAWAKGLTPRAAFKKAQIQLRKEFPSPFYWGAFVMMGE